MASAHTLAVLPFINRSSDPENEYFSDGITEEIINALAKIDALKVISRTSSFAFKGQHMPLKEIADQLDVAYILEGSVRVAHGQVRVSTQLIEVTEDTPLWSESWDRKLENIFDIQDDISLLIAEKLREQLGHFEIAEHLVEKQTESLDAYQLSLKARYYFNLWNPEDVKTSIDLYEKALELDPHHAGSHVGLADGYSFLGTTGFMDGELGWGKAVEHTQKALALDPEHPGAHYLLANISFFLECDFAGAAKHAQKAIAIKANYPDGQQYMAFLYTLRGEFKLAEKHLALALALDPLNQETLFYKAFFLYRKEAFQEAQALLQELLTKNPKNIPAFTVLTYCLLSIKDTAGALQLFENLPQEVVIPEEKLGITCLAEIISNDQKKESTFQILVKNAAAPQAYQAHSYLFVAYVLLHQFDEAFALLEKSIAAHSPIFLISYADPLVKVLKSDARYTTFHQQLYPEIQLALESSGKKPTLLDDATAQAHTQKLLTYVEQESPFLNPALSLRSLAALIEIHPNQLSWLLNTQLQKNFNEFINEYRVEHFKVLAKDPSNNHISLMGLAFESGFNSKTVFNTFFKKMTGITPSAFVKSQA